MKLSISTPVICQSHMGRAVKEKMLIAVQLMLMLTLLLSRLTSQIVITFVCVSDFDVWRKMYHITLS